jgi:hypothetical protein
VYTTVEGCMTPYKASTQHFLWRLVKQKGNSIPLPFPYILINRFYHYFYFELLSFNLFPSYPILYIPFRISFVPFLISFHPIFNPDLSYLISYPVLSYLRLSAMRSPSAGVARLPGPGTRPPKRHPQLWRDGTHRKSNAHTTYVFDSVNRLSLRFSLYSNSMISKYLYAISSN